MKPDEIMGMVVRASEGFETADGKRIWRVDIDYLQSLLDNKQNEL